MKREILQLLGGDDRGFLYRCDGRKVAVSKLQWKVLGLFFSSRSCEFSQEFNPRLEELYEELERKGIDFKVVQVSFDKNKSSFLKDFKDKPWLAVPYEDHSVFKKLTRRFDVESTPALVVIGSDGEVLNSNAVDYVETYGSKAFPFSRRRLKELDDEDDDEQGEDENDDDDDDEEDNYGNEDDDEEDDDDDDEEEEEEEEIEVLPEKIKHTLHRHVLVKTKRKYCCDSCNEEWRGWSYYCSTCDFDLDIDCALRDEDDFQAIYDDDDDNECDYDEDQEEFDSDDDEEDRDENSDHDRAEDEEEERTHLDDLVDRVIEGRRAARSRGISLNESEIRQICIAASEILLGEPTLLELEAPINVCGDIHGQYADLLRIFEMIGDPPSSRYLFLGDYVDRGKQSIETICLLLAYKIRFPYDFFLLRGNHECSSTNKTYGFYDECRRRYGERIWRVFNKCFDCLPVAAIVDDRIFCVHGGLSPELRSLDQIREMERQEEDAHEGLLCDLLWADPDSGIRGWEESNRGVSYTFGADVVAEFAEEHDLNLICRAHQVMQGGYKFFAGKRLVTVFSAPNYCGKYNNYAAVMRVEDADDYSFEVLKPKK